MLRLRQMKNLQKFASVHASVHNHLSLERNLIARETCEMRRSVAPAELRNLVRTKLLSSEDPNASCGVYIKMTEPAAFYCFE
jgi:hypothetical protein